MKNRPEPPLKGDTIKAMKARQIVKIYLVLYFSDKVQKIAALFLVFSD